LECGGSPPFLTLPWSSGFPQLLDTEKYSLSCKDSEKEEQQVAMVQVGLVAAKAGE
jgi:hypothetical protein